MPGKGMNNRKNMEQIDCVNLNGLSGCTGIKDEERWEKREGVNF